MNTIELIEKSKIIVIVRGVAKDKLIPLAEAMYEGGIRVVECTYDATGKLPDEENAANIAMLAEHFGDRMAVGAGTVLTKKQVQLTKEAGGRFIISPDVNEEVIKETKALDLVSIPGAMTPSEVLAAYEAGGDLIKLFPAGYLGPRYVKDLTAPLSHIPLLATAGITEDNFAAFLEAGCCGAGISSLLTTPSDIAAGNWDVFTARAERLLEIYHEKQ